MVAGYDGHFGKQFDSFFKKYVHYDPVILFLHIFSKEIKIHVHKNSCTRMFIDAFVIPVKKKKKSLSTDG